MERFRKHICRLLVAVFLLTACTFGQTGTAEAAAGTWKHNSKGYWYEYSDGSYAKDQWLKIEKKWYHFDKNGYMQTGWQKISGKWYYFGPKTGAMQTGWKSIGGKTYYFKASGEMAAKEYCGGYWLNQDGSWTTKAKASWKQNSEGWWYEDSAGWCPKSQWLKIDGKDYYFLGSGYLAVNRWVGKSYVGANGAWIPGKTYVNWPKLYKSFLSDKGWETLAQASQVSESSDVRLFDADHNGIPELILGMNVYTCVSGKVVYAGKGTGDWWFYTQTKTDPEGSLCSSATDWNTYKTLYYRYTMSGTKLSGKSIGDPGKTSRRLDSFSVNEMVQELSVYPALLQEEDPVLFLSDMRGFLDQLKYSNCQYDYRKDMPEINCLYWTYSYPTDPVTYSGSIGYQTGNYQEDPKGLFNGNFYKLNGKKTDWILKNVYNCSDTAIADLKKMSLTGKDEFFPIYYQSGYYYTSPYENFEGTYRISIQDIRIVNGLYVVEYCESQSYMGEVYDTFLYHAVLGQKSVSGKMFWSLYIQSDKAPSDTVVKEIKKVKAEKLP